jgi:hypothetical protein
VDALKKIEGDDRSFTFYLPDAGMAVQSLIAEARRRNISPLQLVEAYRLYLVNNFAAVRCADDDLMQGSSGAAAGSWLDVRSAEAIHFFNERIRLAPLLTIQETEAEARAKSGAASGLRACDSDTCAAIAQQYRSLILNAVGMPVPVSARASDEWRDRFRDTLDAVRKWPDGGPQPGAAALQFREKCSFYLELMNLASDAALQQTALKTLLEYLQANRNRAQTRIEWLLPLNLLIGRMSLDPHGLGALLEDLRHAPDPVIALYLQLEAAAPRTTPDVLALM